MYQGLYDTSLTPKSNNSVAYPQVVAGSSFTAALAGDGTVWTWGSNEYGELGIGEVYGTYAYPQQVKQQDGKYLNNVRKLAATGNFIYALKNDGTVWAWGRNDRGQLGLGENTPVRVTLASQVLKGKQKNRTEPAEGQENYIQEIVDIAVGGVDDAHGFALMIQSVYYGRVYENGQLVSYSVLSNNVYGVGDNAAHYRKV